MSKNITGMELCHDFYFQSVKKVLYDFYPTLRYSAGLIDYGSDVLGYDNEISRDHQWGPRLSIFLTPQDLESMGSQLDLVLSEHLPHEFKGYSTHFSGTNKDYIRHMEHSDSGPVQHLIRIHSLEEFFLQHLNLDLHKKIEPMDWLFFPQQRLLTIRKGQFFHDDLNGVEIKKKLEYYPHDIWLYLMACEWEKIGTEEAFVGRCGDVGDDLGSRLIASRLVQGLMNLCFLQEKKYFPYSKWFGSAFKELRASDVLFPIFNKILQAGDWKAREQHLSAAYSLIALRHNDLKITQALATSVRPYYGREYLVLFASEFSTALMSAIKDQKIRSLPRIGSVDQITHSSGILEHSDVIRKLGTLYIGH